MKKWNGASSSKNRWTIRPFCYFWYLVSNPTLRKDSGAIGKWKKVRGQCRGVCSFLEVEESKDSRLVKSLSLSFSIFALSLHAKPQKEDRLMRILFYAVSHMFFFVLFN